MTTPVFDKRWRDWLRHNLARGCDPEELRRILLAEGFTSRTVEREFPIAHPKDQAVAPKRDLGIAATGPDPGLIPNLVRHASVDLELYTAERFLEYWECEDLIRAMQGKLRPSTISTPDEPDKYFRVSKTCDLDPDHPVAGPVDRRICAALRASQASSEIMQAQLYDVGGQFKAHTDYFERHELQRFSTETLGQRTWTFMIYLNEPEAGGETTFVSAGIVLKPRTGLAVIWNNLHPDGSPNPNTLHQGTPVRAGHKAIITKWFRALRRQATG